MKNITIKRCLSLLLSLVAIIVFTAMIPGQQAAANTGTTSAKPAAITGFQVAANGNKLTATWKKVKNAKKYQVQVQIRSNGGWKNAKRSNVRKTSYRFTGKVNKTYRIRVRGIGKSKGKWSTWKRVKTQVQKPAKISGLKLKSTETELRASWNKAKNARKYQVQVEQRRGKHGATPVRDQLISGTTYRFTPDSTGQYRVRVRAVAGKQYGEWCEWEYIEFAKYFRITGTGDTSAVDPYAPEYQNFTVDGISPQRKDLFPLSEIVFTADSSRYINFTGCTVEWFDETYQLTEIRSDNTGIINTYPEAPVIELIKAGETTLYFTFTNENGSVTFDSLVINRCTHSSVQGR